MKNQEIRNKAKETGIHLWQIAEVMGLSDANFSRKLRHELPPAEKEQIFKIIENLKGSVLCH